MQKPVAHSDLISQKRIVKISFFIDLLIVIPVIIIAVLSNSLVLASDVFGYFFTLSASSISLIVLNKCIRNERGKYDFGMGKLESLSALVTSTFMILMLFLLAYLSVIRIVDTVELNVKYVLAGIFIQALGFVINIYIWVQSKKLSRKGASPIMEAQWRVNRANAYSNVFVILSLSLALIFNNSNWANYIDPVSAMLLIAFTGKSFIELIKSSLSDLLDHTLDEVLQLKIFNLLAELEEGYERFYDVRSRKSGSKTFIDISLGFDPVRKIGDALDIARRLKEKLEVEIPGCEVNVLINSLEEFEETMNIKNVPCTMTLLTNKNIEVCIELAKNMFPTEHLENIKTELLASVYPQKYIKQIYDLGKDKPRYWVGIKDDKIVGFAGTYFVNNEPDTVWGGWIAIHPDLIKPDSEILKYMMWKIAFESRQTGRTVFRLSTSCYPNSPIVNQFFDDIGLHIFGKEKSSCYDSLYRQIDIAKLYEKIRPNTKRFYTTVIT